MATICIAAPLLVEVRPDHYLNLSLVTRIHPDRDGLRVEFAVPLPPEMVDAAGSVAHYEVLEGEEATALRFWLRTHSASVEDG